MNSPRTAALALAIVMLGGCAHSRTSSIDDQVAQEEAVDRAQETETHQLAVNLATLLDDYASVDAEYQRATARFDLATQAADRASPQFAMAEQSYQAAERYYRWTVYVLMIAAAHDAIMDGADEVCSGIQSTRAYRRENGIEDSSVCIDHVFAHAIGGVNHPWNYNPLLCSTNSSLGASFWGKFATYPVPMLKGLAVTALARLRCAKSPGAWSR